MLKDTGFLDCKPTSNPMQSNLRLNKEEKLEDPTKFRFLIGKLLYLKIKDQI